MQAQKQIDERSACFIRKYGFQLEQQPGSYRCGRFRQQILCIYERSDQKENQWYQQKWCCVISLTSVFLLSSRNESSMCGTWNPDAEGILRPSIKTPRMITMRSIRIWHSSLVPVGQLIDESAERSYSFPGWGFLSFRRMLQMPTTSRKQSA
jgi:hypothetical protein